MYVYYKGKPFKVPSEQESEFVKAVILGGCTAGDCYIFCENCPFGDSGCILPETHQFDTGFNLKNVYFHSISNHKLGFFYD